MQIYTHINPDLDAACSVWAARTFGGFRQAAVQFVPANWDGASLREEDIAVDIEAGGRGHKGVLLPDGHRLSAFSALLQHFMVRSEVMGALSCVGQFVDAQDAHGSAVNHLAPEASKAARQVLGATGLGAVWRAIQWQRSNDESALEAFGRVLDGLLHNGISRVRGEYEADRVQTLNGRVAIVRNAKHFATNGILFERGIQAIVFVDGYNLGLCRRDDVALRMDHPDLRSVVEDEGELGEWFAHPAGFLFARGTRKAPAHSPSRVDPRQLATQVDLLLAGEAG